MSLAERFVVRLRLSWEGNPPVEVTLGTFADPAMLAAWHPDHTLESHRALIDGVAALLAIDGIKVVRFRVTAAAYERWRGKRQDTPERRARFIGERGQSQPWRLGAHIGNFAGGRPGSRSEQGIGWCAVNLDSGWRVSATGIMTLDD